MEQFVVDTKEAFQDVLSCLQDGTELKHVSENVYKMSGATLEFNKEYEDQLQLHDIIYGINKESNIVNISIKNDLVYIFKETVAGVHYKVLPYKHWVLAKSKLNESFKPLFGKQSYSWYKEYSYEQFEINIQPKMYKMGLYTIHNPAENFMTRQGFTYFKDTKSIDVSVVSFDIETTGLDPKAKDAQVLLITNTYRKGATQLSKTFSVADYKNDGDMIIDWCSWVVEMDPSVMLGHNIVMFDIPYIKGRINSYKKELPIGRMQEELVIEDKPRELRKDGSQSYTYHRVNCFGREVVDTFFLAIKADTARKYESYGLKSIIKQEGLEEADRQQYDAASIGKNWHIPEERAKIIAYAEADSRDPIKLYDLMIAPFFYLTPYIPKPFQIMMESATGSQINSLMVRSYLQKNMSVAEGSPSVEFEGAISFGNTGIYKNVYKVDVASLYPSIMRHHKIYPEKKDFNLNFAKMLEYFTVERLKNKALAKETGDRYYDDLQNSQKVLVNSCYGFLGAKGLNYNFPSGAAAVTKYGREVVTKAVEWATGHTLEHKVKHIRNEGKENEEIEREWVIGKKIGEGKGYTISNCDTDSISFTCGKDLTLEDRKNIIVDINSHFPEMIRFEDDGYYPVVCILKAKNYILFDGKKIKLKGSSIRDQKKEPGLKEMMDKMINCIIFDNPQNLINIYHDYIRETMNVQDIRRWCAKKTITKAVLNCAHDPEARMNEVKVYDAVKDIPGLQEGDKVYLYPTILGTEIIPGGVSLKTGKPLKDKSKLVTGLKLAEKWVGDEDKDKLIQRVVDTVDIFANVIDINQFVDYTLNKNKNLLTSL